MVQIVCNPRIFLGRMTSLHTEMYDINVLILSRYTVQGSTITINGKHTQIKNTFRQQTFLYVIVSTILFKLY